MRIKILKGKLEGHSFEINSDNFIIGREPENDIQIPDSSISRQHAKIFKSGKKYFIKDLKSCNGTWVDGRLIWPGNEIELRQGLRLSVGDTLLTLDDLDSDSSSAFSYSIDLLSAKARGNMDFLFKDRRIANRKNLELICEISEALLRPLELDTICEKILEHILYNLKRITSCENLIPDSYGQALTGFDRVSLVKITIMDNRTYLKKNELLEIFTPGISLETGSLSNIGAGLVSAYWTVEKNMGRLVVISEEEKGTELSIYLPSKEGNHSR